MAQISTNERFIEDRKKIGRYASLGGLGIIFAGLIASFQNQIVLAYGALISGFILSNIGAYFLSRWGTGAHEKLVSSLKGLDKRYRLYNYLLPAPNVLLSPYGITVLLVKNQEGQIVADENGWKQPSGMLGNMVRFMRAFSTEALGDPPKELKSQEKAMKEFVAKSLGGDGRIPIDGLVLFTNPRADVTLVKPSVPTIALNKQPDALKNALRRDKRSPQLPPGAYDNLLSLFEKEAEEKSSATGFPLRFWRR